MRRLFFDTTSEYQTEFGLCRLAVLFIVSLGGVVLSNSANAVGFDQARLESYIGEPLRAKVPLLNLDSEKTLSITLEQKSDTQLKGLTAKLEMNNSIVLITSSGSVVEPFINFTLVIDTSQGQLAREFTLLMDLPPTIGVKDTSVDGVRRESYETSSSDLMGPYDWAESDSVAKRFGPVLQGQSLWRVARRINKALDVSLEQMMVALYQENPKAFVTKSISSLQAGSILSIPSKSKAISLTQSQAREFLDGLENQEVVAIPAAVQIPDSNQGPQTGTTEETFLQEQRSSGTEERKNRFMMSSVIEATSGRQADADESLIDKDSIIQSLSESIARLTQELRRKDDRIEALEAQLSGLQNSVKHDDVATNGEFGTATSAKNYQESGHGGSSITDNSKSNRIGMSTFWWLLPPVLLIAWFLRGPFFRLRNSIFARDQLVEFDEGYSQVADVDTPERDVTIKQAVDRIMRSEQDSQEMADSESSRNSGGCNPPKGSTKTSPPKTDFQTLQSDNVEKDETESVVKVLDISEDSEHHTESDDDSELPFDDRYRAMLEEEDFAFAREYLEFARYNIINDDKYHCEKLRLHVAMSDEEAFYDYYYEIEAKIPSLPSHIQTEISKFVVQLAKD